MSEMNDPYDDQLRAARYRAERDQAREELARIDGGAQAAHRTYGALSDEDRKILWWVHARGGLQEVRRRLKKSVPHEAYERKRGAWRRHIRACEEALRKRNARIRELENAALERRIVRAEDREAAEWVRDHGGLDAVEQRLMPEGMEWPRFEDGEPVRIGDYFEDFFGDDIKVCHIDIDNKGSSINFGGPNSKHIASGERVRRPAPKVLDADGVEIRVGDTVYDTELMNGDKFTVESIDKNGDVAARGDKYILTQSSVAFTHRAPVLAADGKPLREGETVWSVDSGTRYTVEKITDGIIPIKCRSEMGSTVSLHPAQLTHERPDSWERIEEDKNKTYTDYWECDRIPCYGCPAIVDGKRPDERYNSANCAEAVKCDLVSRARALAERDA